MSTVEAKPIITQAQWEQSPKLATRMASQVLLDAGRNTGSTTTDQAKQAMAEVIAHAMSAASSASQDHAMTDIVLATVSSNKALASFGFKLGAAWRAFTVTRTLCSDSSAAAAAHFSSQTVEAMLAGARATLDQTVAMHVGEAVRSLATQPASTPEVQTPSATPDESAVVNMRDWAAANRRKR